MSNVNFIPILTNKNAIDSIDIIEGQYLICLDDDNSSLYIDYTDSKGNLVRKEIIDGSKYATKELLDRTTQQAERNEDNIMLLREDVDMLQRKLEDIITILNYNNIH